MDRGARLGLFCWEGPRPRTGSAGEDDRRAESECEGRQTGEAWEGGGKNLARDELIACILIVGSTLLQPKTLNSLGWQAARNL